MKRVPNLRRSLLMAGLVAGTAAALIGAGAPGNTSLSGTTPALAADAAPQAQLDSQKPDEQRPESRGARMREHLAQMDRHLSVDQVRDIVAGRLALSGDDNLKVGKATAEANDAVAVDVTTKTGAVVATKEYSTKTGLPLWLTNRLTNPNVDRNANGGAGIERPSEQRPMMWARLAHHMHEGWMRHENSIRSWLGAGPGHDLNLTTDQARKLAEARLITLGNNHLKVGAVREKDADTITVDIVATDNSLVAQENINRHNGRPEHKRA